VGNPVRTRSVFPHRLHPFFRGYHIVTAAARACCDAIKKARQSLAGPRSFAEKITRAASGRTASGAAGTCPPTAKNSAGDPVCKVSPCWRCWAAEVSPIEGVENLETELELEPLGELQVLNNDSSVVHCPAPRMCSAPDSVASLARVPKKAVSKAPGLPGDPQVPADPARRTGIPTATERRVVREPTVCPIVPAGTERFFRPVPRSDGPLRSPS